MNRFDHKEIYNVMDLCLSCKGCKSECPSNVDVAKLKAEFLQHYYDANGVPFRSKLIANFNNSARLGAIAPGIYNFFMTTPGVRNLVKRFSGFATRRSMPTLYKKTLRSWYKKRFPITGYQLPVTGNQQPATGNQKKVYLFCDEFTNYNDTEIGIKAILLLEKLGYEVIIPEHIESGRAWLSKGLLRKAKQIANKNIELLSPLITSETPLIGIEPSAILTFRDEYIDLADEDKFETAKALSKNVFMLEEFIASEIGKGNISSNLFSKEEKVIKLHGHCQQKAMSSVAPAVKILSLPENYSVQTIPSGCCGMAGSFGYEKEHYDLSMKIGEMVLFPTVRQQPADVIIAAAGTSCRHQVKDGTGRKALHPAEILYDALV
jgi:Fe-S oxidoreductase